MKAFEIIFNPLLPKTRRKLEGLGQTAALFDCFSFFNRTGLFNRLGHLFLLGQVENVLTKNKEPLQELAKFITQLYYTKSSQSRGKNFEAFLPLVNDFFIDFPDFTWHLVLVGLNRKRQLNFTVLGKEIALILLSHGQAYNLLYQQNNPSVGLDPNQTAPPLPPNKDSVFSHIIAGQLAKKDKLVLLTKPVFDFFNKESIFPQLGKLTSPNEAKQFFQKNQAFFHPVYGPCLIVFI